MIDRRADMELVRTARARSRVIALLGFRQAGKTTLVRRFVSSESLRPSSESLAGRLETVSLEGFRVADLGAAAQGAHWLRGGFSEDVARESGTGTVRYGVVG